MYIMFFLNLFITIYLSISCIHDIMCVYMICKINLSLSIGCSTNFHIIPTSLFWRGQKMFFCFPSDIVSVIFSWCRLKPKRCWRPKRKLSLKLRAKKPFENQWLEDYTILGGLSELAVWVVVGREQEDLNLWSSWWASNFLPKMHLKVLFSQGPFWKEFHLTIINFLNRREGSMGDSDTKARIHLIFPKIWAIRSWIWLWPFLLKSDPAKKHTVKGRTFTRGAPRIVIFMELWAHYIVKNTWVTGFVHLYQWSSGPYLYWFWAYLISCSKVKGYQNLGCVIYQFSKLQCTVWDETRHQLWWRLTLLRLSTQAFDSGKVVEVCSFAAWMFRERKALKIVSRGCFSLIKGVPLSRTSWSEEHFWRPGIFVGSKVTQPMAQPVKVWGWHME